MKTAISVPDETFVQATSRAHELGLSRSEFFARAARRYLDDLDASSVTKQIDEALGRLDGSDESSADAVRAGRQTLADTGW
jgi:hypothetical protein